MQKTIVLLFALGVSVSALGAWYWPFGHDEDDPSQPARLHRLLEEANNYIEIAEEEALDGNGDKALENYRLALAELDRVEKENPERAETAEFSPLRNKRAACVAAMDVIRFAQVNENERAVSVTDTRELQKKWNKKHGIKDEEEDKAEEKKPEEKLEEKKAEEKPEEKPEEKKAEGKPEEKAAEKKAEEKKVDEEKPVEQSPGEKKAEPPKVEEKAEPPKKAEDFNFRLKTALAEVRNRDYAAADLMLEALEKERPNELNVLLLRSAAQVGLGSNFAARRTLEKAMRAHPKSYLPYYNMVNVVLKLGEDVEQARQYYEMGRAVGGPASEALEALLKAKK